MKRQSKINQPKIKIFFKDKLNLSKSTVTVVNITDEKILLDRKDIGSASSITIPYSKLKINKTYKLIFIIRNKYNEIIDSKDVTFKFTPHLIITNQNDQEQGVLDKRFLLEVLEDDIQRVKEQSVSDTTVFAWPVPGYNRVTSKFGLRMHPVEKVMKNHNGIDVGAPLGATVIAVNDGKVMSARNSETAGLFVVIAHQDGFRSKYMHLNKIFVKPGQIVKLGEAIGEVGKTGRVTGPHLHFEILKDNRPQDPLQYLNFNNNVAAKTSTSQNTSQAIHPRTTSNTPLDEGSYIIPEDIKRKYPQQTAFIEQIYPFALKIHNQTGIPWQIVVAQACLESGYGKSEIKDIKNPSRRSYNLFGIKYKGSAANRSRYAETWTHEMIPEEQLNRYKIEHPELIEKGRTVNKKTGKNFIRVKIIDKFAVYNSFEEALAKYSKELLNKNFKHALRSRHDPVQYIKDIQGELPGGSNRQYATDISYTEKIIRIMTMFKMV